MKGQSSFHAVFRGRCKGCNGFYRPGDTIWSPGQGQGAYHNKCQPKIVRRQATSQDLELIRLRSLLRKTKTYLR